MATSFKRTAIVQALQQHLADHADLVTVPVFAAPPRYRPLRFIWLVAGEGDVDIPVMRAGRKVRDDSFGIDVWCVHVGEGDPDGLVTAAGAEQLGSAVDDLLADDPHLQVDDIDHVLTVTLERADGPDVAMTDTGYEAAMHLVVRAQVRMT